MEKETLSDEMQVIEYMDQMNEKEKKAYAIAMEHLGTSFDIIKSNGYLNWKKK